MSENRPLRSARLLALFGVGALLVAACSGAAAPTPSATPVATSASTSTATSGATATSASGATVNVATSATIGKYLAGPNGKTLYVKQGDAATAATNCTGTCLAHWPALTVSTGQQVVAGAGVTGTLATFVRPEGTTQVTYNGAPLYYFVGDAAAGDTTGQGVGGFTAAVP